MSPLPGSAVLLGPTSSNHLSPKHLLPSSCPSLSWFPLPLSSSYLHSLGNLCSFHLWLLLTILTAPSLLMSSSLWPPWCPVLSSLAPGPAAFPTPCPLPGLGGPLGPLCLLAPPPWSLGQTNLSVTSLPSHCDLFSSSTLPEIFSHTATGF